MTHRDDPDTSGPSRRPVARAATPTAGPRVISADSIPRELLDEDALRVIARLERQGFAAYLVGGCVRDLLIGRTPKDFDVATDAHPRQIKRLFRNARVIGRRFKLVHVVYGQHIVETATFRSDPLSAEAELDPDALDAEAGPLDAQESSAALDDLLITEDNEFGTAEEDARRRDFTVKSRRRASSSAVPNTLSSTIRRSSGSTSTTSSPSSAGAPPARNGSRRNVAVSMMCAP